MKLVKVLTLMIGFLPAFALAQIPFEPVVVDDPGVSMLSPLSHLKPVMALNKTASAQAFRCATFLYYQNDPQQATYHYFTESLPVSSKWAMKITAPQTVTVCTVWSVKVDFELLGASAIDKDTIRFFIKEASPPYTEIFNTYFIARIGLNRGYYEIDPPIVPPFNVRSILNPKRDVFIGYYVIGDSSHSVKWRFTTPMLSQYTNPPRSYRFIGPTSPQPASMAVGLSVDWVAESRLCCDYPVPVELSTFNAVVEGQVLFRQLRSR